MGIIPILLERVCAVSALVLTLDGAGTPLRWDTWEDAAIAHCKNQVAWATGDLTDHFGGINRISGNRSFISIPSIMALKGVYAKSRKIVRLNNRALFGRDRHTCAYCGDVFQPSKLTRDHVVPVSRGGKNTFMNCVTSCKKCNNRKDNKLLEECGMVLLYLPYVPCNNEALILANRNILADQMQFLLAKVPKHSRVFMS